MIKPNKSWGLLGVGVLLGAGAAYAADARYNTALEGIDRAKTMLEAVGTNANEKPGAAFQRKRALRALERAKIRINCAKEIEDSNGKKRGCPAAMKDRFDDNDDDKDKDDAHDHKGHADKDGKKESGEKPKGPPNAAKDRDNAAKGKK